MAKGEADNLKSRRKKAKLAANSKEQTAITPLRVFRYDLFKELLRKNPNVNVPKNMATVHAFFQTAAVSVRWESLSDADKASYAARSSVLRKQHCKATSIKASNLADILGNLKL